jgi:hypothetical protein
VEGIRPDPPRNPKPRTVTATRVLRDALPHLHQLRGDPREASPQRGAAQRPEPPRASPLPGHLRPQRCAGGRGNPGADSGRLVAVAGGGWRRALAKSGRAGIIYSSSVSGSWPPPAPSLRDAGCRGERPAPPRRSDSKPHPPPCPRDTEVSEGGREKQTGWRQVLKHQVLLPFPLGPQFLHLEQGKGLESADLESPSHSDVLNWKKKRYLTGVGGGQSGHVAMATGAQGYPGLYGLASCPEAALVTLDTRLQRGDGEQGMAWSDLTTAAIYGRFLKESASSPAQDRLGCPWKSWGAFF